MRRIVYLIFLFPVIAFAQYQTTPDAAHIKAKLKKLNVLGSVLYVAAHPDDENTRIITYMANDRQVETAYLSMTRGDGGQNLIGPEIRDLLGLIRTQELLAARRIDGGKQFFTRANDFGFSKSATETFLLWNKNEILSDVVKVFRQYQPDVIITRFPPDERAGHGHHTASAILAQEAFDAAAKTDVFPDQLTSLTPWQVKRLYTNTGRWWNTTISESTPGVVTLNVGGFSPLLGESFTEIAAESRSQHKSQGYGSRGARGQQQEFLEYVKGEKAEKDMFEGVNTTWSRVKGGDKIQPLVDAVIKNFDAEKPANSIAALQQIRQAIAALQQGVWRERKLAETEQLIVDCLGLFIDVTADNYWVAPGQPVVVSFELINRSTVPVKLERIQCATLAVDSAISQPLENNVPLIFKRTKEIAPATAYSDPYWLKEPHSVGLFTVTNPALIGKPENDPAVRFSFQLTVNGQPLTLTRALRYTWTDPVKAELSRPFEIVPPVFVNLTDNVLVFSDETPRQVNVKIKSASEKTVAGNVKLQLPAGWRSEPATATFTLPAKGEEDVKTFTVYPSKTEITSKLKAYAEVDGKIYDQALLNIAYDHIPTQTLLPKAEAKLVRINLRKEGHTIAYIKGAGDDVPAGLRTMGYTVWEPKNEELTLENLKKADAIVLGVRVMNTHPRAPFIMPVLLDYVKQGGTLVVQYNVNDGLKTDKLGPYPLALSYDRVTEEDAEVRFLKPDHAVLNTPNKITAKDFEGWVQERGLYFPKTWDEKYTAILSMNDKADTPKDGSLLVASYGEGHFVYTGLSFFRELPEGVAGAYKLFANLVSLGKPKKTEPAKSKTKAK
ncbi:PIG-L family deacetylase [Chryseolinea lacunae]|uniref:PIG-L family deacetylase n=1 Tax=Chryseolinea lacunae TaxID=2801331 RepID=A0ABS1KZ54_9BACT|nr:PIG-L family deacetylase [Chryseolinea lacunae]MBL0743601.1 PIG-L family deacetylase [Chryseolinea lacunae]